MRKTRSAFTLVEVLIVVVIMGILASLVVPQFLNSTQDAKGSTSVFDLRTIRSQMVLYKAHHPGDLPSATWAELLTTTNAKGEVGTGSSYPYGPYLNEVPVNSVTKSATITTITNSPAQAGDVTSDGGWLYNPTTGGVWINHKDYYHE